MVAGWHDCPPQNKSLNLLKRQHLFQASKTGDVKKTTPKWHISRTCWSPDNQGNPFCKWSPSSWIISSSICKPIHPWFSTWNLKMAPWKRGSLLKINHFKVCILNFGGVSPYPKLIKEENRILHLLGSQELRVSHRTPRKMLRMISARTCELLVFRERYLRDPRIPSWKGENFHGRSWWLNGMQVKWDREII